MAGEMPDADCKARSASPPSAAGFPQPSAPPQPHQHYQYGTFGPPSASGELPQPAVGFPQPAPPPGLRHYPPPPPASYAVYPPLQPYSAAAPYYAQGYQAVHGYIRVVEGRPVRMRRLPCCGLGMGWFLFIIGFFLAAVPWYIGAFVLICVRVHDYREKPGYVACTIAMSFTKSVAFLALQISELGLKDCSLQHLSVFSFLSLKAYIFRKWFTRQVKMQSTLFRGFAHGTHEEDQ